MEVTLYNFSKRHNSTKQPSGGTVKNLVLKDMCSKTNPQFFINGDNTATYLKAWGMYYFIDEYKYDINNACYIICSLDVLATFKENILNTSAFVKYSTTSYNALLNDSRINILTNTNYHTSDTQSSLFLTRNHSNEVVILTCNGIAGTMNWVLDEDSVRTLSAELSLAVTEIGEELEKQFGSVNNAIFSAYRLPIEPSMLPSTGPDTIYLGNYNTGYEAAWLASGYTEERGDVTIPWQYSDYRNNAPYTELFLELPYVGVVQLDVSSFIGKSKIGILTCVNILTGHVDYRIFADSVNNPVANFSASCGGTLHVNVNSLSDARGVIDQMLSTATRSISTPTPGGLAKNIHDITDMAMDLQSIKISSIGSYSGGYGEVLNTKYRCILITHNTIQEPSELANLYGRPCSKVMSLSSLTGYVQTQDISVEVDTLDSIRTQINQMVDSGIYIE